MGAILGCGSAEDVPSQGRLEVYRAVHPNTSISTPWPMPKQKRGRE
jgi:hypothetical protein